METFNIKWTLGTDNGRKKKMKMNRELSVKSKLTNNGNIFKKKHAKSILSPSIIPFLIQPPLSSFCTSKPYPVIVLFISPFIALIELLITVVLKTLSSPPKEMISISKRNKMMLKINL